MPQSTDPVAKALSGAKSTLAHATTAFPSPQAAAPAKSAPPAKPAIPATPTPSGLGVELAEKTKMVAKGRQALGIPTMHNGGPVKKDGPYQLKAGEHVLTAPEAAKARKHALMAAGLKSLAKPGKK